MEQLRIIYEQPVGLGGTLEISFPTTVVFSEYVFALCSVSVFGVSKKSCPAIVFI
jgi:hypothetical protein